LSASDGEVLIPDLLSYQNNEVSRDLSSFPLDHEVTTGSKHLVPRYRSGVFCDFQAKRFTAITGQVKTFKDGKEIVLKLGRLSLIIAGEEKHSPNRVITVWWV
jgi:outer membrane usher protein